MPAGRYLCHGVSWTRQGPFLALTTPYGEPAPLSLAESGQPVPFGLRLADQPGERFCLGYSAAVGPAERRTIPCPTQTTAERGYQCGPCFARDDFRFMHDVHRSGVAPPGLAAYLAQDHWLYVATFADGTMKVGTASDRSKWSRLTEQGAVVARYVAQAKDGRIVRVLEDAVTRSTGLTQAVRSAAKTAALSRPLPPAELDARNAATAEEVRGILGSGVGVEGFSVVRERWQPPESWDAVLAARALEYPLSLDSGEHGGAVLAVLGQTALLELPEDRFLLNLALLRGRRLELGAFRSPPVAVQAELF